MKFPVELQLEIGVWGDPLGGGEEHMMGEGVVRKRIERERERERSEDREMEVINGSVLKE